MKEFPAKFKKYVEFLLYPYAQTLFFAAFKIWKRVERGLERGVSSNLLNVDNNRSERFLSVAWTETKPSGILRLQNAQSDKDQTEMPYLLLVGL